MQSLLYNATLVLPEHLVDQGWLLIENGRIAELGEGDNYPPVVNRIDVGGEFVMPGLIDLHCDAIEKVVEPRPGVHFPVALALQEIDRRLAVCGVTTEFHAIFLDDNEFGTRSTEFVREVADTLKGSTNTLVHHEIHARLELTSKRGYEVVTELVREGEVRLVSLMDHSPGHGQYTSEQAYRDYIKRTYHRTDQQIDELLNYKKSQSNRMSDRIANVSKMVRNAGLALATHDDDSASKVEQWPALGVTIAEFPTTFEAAQRAHELGLAVCLGAPNVVRGKSSGGNLSALAAIEAGVADVLCADYYPAAMLAAVFKLVESNLVSLPEATRMVSLNPAKAIGMDYQIGSLQAGKQADLIVVGRQEYSLPSVRRVFVNGQERLTLN